MVQIKALILIFLIFFSGIVFAAVDINVVSPSDANYINQNSTLLKISIYHSALNFQDLYSIDYNFVGNKSTFTYSDVNGNGWNCDSNVITTTQNCYRNISLASFFDGNYTFSVSAFDGTDYNYDSGGSFMIDRNSPITYISDIYQGGQWSSTDQNIHLSCNDYSGQTITYDLNGSSSATVKYPAVFYIDTPHSGKLSLGNIQPNRCIGGGYQIQTLIGFHQGGFFLFGLIPIMGIY